MEFLTNWVSKKSTAGHTLASAVLSPAKFVTSLFVMNRGSLGATYPGFFLSFPYDVYRMLKPSELRIDTKKREPETIVSNTPIKAASVVQPRVAKALPENLLVQMDMATDEIREVAPQSPLETFVTTQELDEARAKKEELRADGIMQREAVRPELDRLFDLKQQQEKNYKSFRRAVRVYDEVMTHEKSKLSWIGKEEKNPVIVDATNDLIVSKSAYIQGIKTEEAFESKHKKGLCNYEEALYEFKMQANIVQGLETLSKLDDARTVIGSALIHATSNGELTKLQEQHRNIARTITKIRGMVKDMQNGTFFDLESNNTYFERVSEKLNNPDFNNMIATLSEEKDARFKRAEVQRKSDAIIKSHALNEQVRSEGAEVFRGITNVDLDLGNIVPAEKSLPTETELQEIKKRASTKPRVLAPVGVSSEGIKQLFEGVLYGTTSVVEILEPKARQQACTLA